VRLAQLTSSYPVEIVGPREIRSESVQDAEQARKVFGANLALEGSLSQSDHRIRVSYSLVDTATRRQVHADTVTVDEVSGPLSLEDRLVESIVSILGIELRPNDRTVLLANGTSKPAAYDYYLRGRGFLQDYTRPGNLAAAIDAFHRALELDGHYALASAGLGEAYWHQYEASRDSRLMSEALASLSKMLRGLPRACPMAMFAWRGVQLHWRVRTGSGRVPKTLNVDATNDDAFRGLAAAEENLGRPAEAEQTYQKAIQLRPQYWAGYAWLGGYYFHHARYDDAAHMYTDWIALAPDSSRVTTTSAPFICSRDATGEAIHQLRRSAEINPSLDAYSNLGTAYFYQGSMPEAARAYREAARVGEHDSDVYYAWGNLAEAYYWDPGERERAAETYRHAIALGTERLAVNPRNAGVLSDLALYHAMLLEKSPALDLLQRLCD